MESITYHWTYALISTIFFIGDLLLRIALSIRVIMSKKNYGVSYAWLIVILLLPLLGSAVYLCFGESRLPDRRIKRTKTARKYYHHWLQTLSKRSPINWNQLNSELENLHLHTINLVGIPAMANNRIELLQTPQEIMQHIVRDINSAQSTCHLQFYIWQDEGLVEQVTDALVNAASRGVVCRILLDSIGSKSFFKSPSAKRMKDAGIKIHQALPSGIIKAFFARIDIRNHRKIVIIDGRIAYTGSQNMVDPDHFKQRAGVGKWVDIMARIQGPVVETFAGTFASDWYLESDTDTFQVKEGEFSAAQIRNIGDIYPCAPAGESAVQLVPSGPGFTQDAIHSLLLAAIYTARKELILTTPYFIPDESLLIALKTAASRGVDVTLIVPKHNDSRLVKYASRAKYDDLAHAGVKILLFDGGLLHSKTITIDGTFSLLGSVNLDMRSFWLNFETTLVIYCSKVTSDIRDTQLQYAEISSPLDLLDFHRRGIFERLKENSALLVSPIL